jgi:hypothetical protein
MRLSLFILGVFAALVCIEKPAAAQTYQRCAYYDVWEGVFNISTMPGGRERRWRIVRGQSAVPRSGSRPVEASASLSLLVPHKGPAR